jgi:hypothetical protein
MFTFYQGYCPNGSANLNCFFGTAKNIKTFFSKTFFTTQTKNSYLTLQRYTDWRNLNLFFKIKFITL